MQKQLNLLSEKRHEEINASLRAQRQTGEEHIDTLVLKMHAVEAKLQDALHEREKLGQRLSAEEARRHQLSEKHETLLQQYRVMEDTCRELLREQGVEHVNTQYQRPYSRDSFGSPQSNGSSPQPSGLRTSGMKNTNSSSSLRMNSSDQRKGSPVPNRHAVSDRSTNIMPDLTLSDYAENSFSTKGTAHNSNYTGGNLFDDILRRNDVANSESLDVPIHQAYLEDNDDKSSHFESDQEGFFDRLMGSNRLVFAEHSKALHRSDGDIHEIPEQKNFDTCDTYDTFEFKDLKENHQSLRTSSTVPNHHLGLQGKSSPNVGEFVTMTTSNSPEGHRSSPFQPFENISQSKLYMNKPSFYDERLKENSASTTSYSYQLTNEQQTGIDPQESKNVKLSADFERRPGQDYRSSDICSLRTDWRSPEQNMDALGGSDDSMTESSVQSYHTATSHGKASPPIGKDLGCTSSNGSYFFSSMDKPEHLHSAINYSQKRINIRSHINQLNYETNNHDVTGTHIDFSKRFDDGSHEQENELDITLHADLQDEHEFLRAGHVLTSSTNSRNSPSLHPKLTTQTTYRLSSFSHPRNNLNQRIDGYNTSGQDRPKQNNFGNAKSSNVGLLQDLDALGAVDMKQPVEKDIYSTSNLPDPSVVLAGLKARRHVLS